MSRWNQAQPGSPREAARKAGHAIPRSYCAVLGHAMLRRAAQWHAKLPAQQTDLSSDVRTNRKGVPAQDVSAPRKPVASSKPHCARSLHHCSISLLKRVTPTHAHYLAASVLGLSRKQIHLSVHLARTELLSRVAKPG